MKPSDEFRALQRAGVTPFIQEKVYTRKLDVRITDGQTKKIVEITVKAKPFDFENGAREIRDEVIGKVRKALNELLGELKD